MKKSARRRPQTRPSKLPAILSTIITILLIALVVGILLSRSSWPSGDRFALTINTQSGEVLVVVADPSSQSLTEITIPKTTQVQVARELGTWQIGSVWELGQQEGHQGQLLSDTIIKSLKFPINAWAAEPARNLFSENILHQLNAIFLPFQTSLSFKDRIQLTLFRLKLKSGNYLRYNLADTGYLKETQLLSGEQGYEIKNTIPTKLTRLFTSSILSSANPRIGIIDQSSSPTITTEISDIVSVLGAKVVSIKTEKSDKHQKADCLVYPKNNSSQIIAKLFNCQLKNDQPSNLDIEILITQEFVSRF